MNIGIIGSGNLGSGLGKLWARKGHNVVFTYSRNPLKLKALARSVPNGRSATPKEASETCEVLLLSVGWSAVEGALGAAGPMEGKVLIDCTNPLTPDFSDLAIGLNTSGAEEIAKLAPGAKVVKSFNTAFADLYHSDSRLFGSRRLTMFYCGDDESAKATVSKLINELGLAPVDAGPLKSARYLEPLGMLMIQLGYTQGMGTNIGLSLIRR